MLGVQGLWSRWWYGSRLSWGGGCRGGGVEI